MASNSRSRHLYFARPRYQKIDLKPEQVKFIREGRNVLAVKTRRDYWLAKPYGLIDVGLEAAKQIGRADN
ncbi:MAG: hypothetical protein QGH42_01510 [Kiritimatiellia bacterium]|nr:hypothetical protein [Kiritimatiellia bacterium]MDP6810181.1 hypothetical protein [Kiritimatiellia bacterium]MDP7022913.1 hypothetical protein [Kiritimatiellia bacterium]